MGKRYQGIRDFQGNALSYRMPLLVTQTRTYPKGNSYPVCPRCGGCIDREYVNFCDQCGQRLVWKCFHG